ncbi:predicted protein [Uncinocarpus reesii 1704]|uniref:Uncharacterized protein n=1 Tax=Uncinocarpus reesii (strain UAMH 1704) TaxID=336963 RepID=C4JZF1_UNCRE|nr:uncharacterized protein UREG_07552 [Uncinocarpus reesii 1704]EEP82687.1 predicted protein [Uncinocarpus reesii 1704]
MSDAAELVNKTVPIPDDPGHYAIALDVFHQLHCLNAIRQKIWATEAVDPNDDTLSIEHVDHCIDSIRQSLMCSSDITPIVFQWDEEEQEAKAMANVMHQCRDFEAIWQWGKEHHSNNFNMSKHVDDPLDM